MLRITRYVWLLCFLFAMVAISVAILRLLPSEQHDIRYVADGERYLAEESKYISAPPSGRYVSVAVGAGFTNDGDWFRVVGSELHLSAVPSEPSTTVLALPEDLLNSHSWSVTVSADGDRIVCVNERGMAVWRRAAPHDLMHSWANTAEPMAGKKVSHANIGDAQYDLHELEVAYDVSPDGRLACVHAMKQESVSYQDAQGDGIVIVRDLETGQDIDEMAHFDSGRVIESLTWSGDSQRLATFAPKIGQVTVWDVAKAEPISEITDFAGSHITELANQLALSRDGSLLYVVFTSANTSGTISPCIVVCRVADGSRVASRRVNCQPLVFSPDGRYLAARTSDKVGNMPGGNIELMQSSTLETVWRSSIGEYEHIKHIEFRSDGAELAAVGLNVSSYYAIARVMAWNTNSGTVVLDAPTSPGSASSISGVAFGKDGAIWTYGPSHWNRFKRVK